MSVQSNNCKIETEIKQESNYFELPSFKEQFMEIITKYLKFLLIPGKKCEDLEQRKLEFNKLKSKRSFLSNLNNTLTKIGLMIVFIIITWAVFAPWIAPFNYLLVSGIDYSVSSFAPPSAEHILGVTKFGRDVYSRLIWGARISLSIGLLSIIISMVFGVAIGIFSAYQGGWVDNVIMRIMDIVMAFPGLIIVIIIISITGPEMDKIMLIYGFLGIPGYARLIRSTALQEKNRNYIQSAIVSGASNARVMFRHILPNCIAPIIISVTFDIGGIVLSLAGLSFLGFADPRLIEWGSDISLGRVQIYSAPWAALWPGFGILLAVLGFMLVGDGLRDALDPRLQGKGG